MLKKYSFIAFLLFFSLGLGGQSDYWRLSGEGRIVLDLTQGTRLPHRDNIEMSGRNVSAIVNYEIDKNKKVSITKDVIFPQLRTFLKSNDPEWKKYRAYFRKTVDGEITPSLAVGETIITPTTADSIAIDGMLTVYYTPVNGLKVTKTFYPSPVYRLFIEEWKVENVDKVQQVVKVANCHLILSEQGYRGKYNFRAFSKGSGKKILEPGESFSFPLYHSSTLNDETPLSFNFQKEKAARAKYLQLMRENLVLETPDPVLNTLFYFSKVRAAESIFESSMGLVHSSGGGNYYVGIRANDQVEYSGPFFPYLGYPIGNKAAYNAYKKFAQHIPAEDRRIPYAFEVDGNFQMSDQDRGDAAMIAYGTSRYLLLSGNKEQASELWPLIDWALEYCEKKKNAQGIIESDTDEMEGRVETGKANLSTTSLYYGGLKFAAQVAEGLGMAEKAKLYRQRMISTEQAIETYFGATVAGLQTYRYFEGNKFLHHRICLPLTMGISKRKKSTLDALFNNLWTENGVLVEKNPQKIAEGKTLFWDRATLYALRGALKVGATAIGTDKLKKYSRKRLLGDHVPYAVEAYPENNMKHLSAESALYCRIFIEGMLGLEPTGFSSFTMRPYLPAGWDNLSLKNLHLFGQSIDIELERTEEGLQIMISQVGKVLTDKVLTEVGEELSVDLP